MPPTAARWVLASVIVAVAPAAAGGAGRPVAATAGPAADGGVAMPAGGTVAAAKNNDAGLGVAGGSGGGGWRRFDGGGDTRAAWTLAACPRGYQQIQPVALSCDGGTGRSRTVLSPAGVAGNALSWQVPAGTKDLEANATFQPPGGSGATGAAAVGLALTAQCISTESLTGNTALIDARHGLLNLTTVTASIGGAMWSWSGDPAVVNAQGLYVDGFRIIGNLHCNMRVTLSNTGSTELQGDLTYTWTGLAPCPHTPPGCRSCPTGVCSVNYRAVCDGSPSWRCLPSQRPTVSHPQGGQAPPTAAQFAAAAAAAARAAAAGEALETQLRAPPAPAPLAPGSAASDAWIPGPRARGQLEALLFWELDRGGDGHLREADLYRLAAVQGTAPAQNSSAWNEVYSSVVSRYSVPAKGVNLTTFRHIVEDGYRGGQFNFYSIVGWLGKLKGVNDREVLAPLIFHALDENRDGQLDIDEFSRFASLTGLPRPDRMEWEDSLGGQAVLAEMLFEFFLVEDWEQFSVYALGTVLAKLVDEDQQSRMARLVFSRLDRDHSGHLDEAELQRFTMALSSVEDPTELALNPVAATLRNEVILELGKHGAVDPLVFARFLRADPDLFSRERLLLVQALLEAETTTTTDWFQAHIGSLVARFTTTRPPRIPVPTPAAAAAVRGADAAAAVSAAAAAAQRSEAAMQPVAAMQRSGQADAAKSATPAPAAAATPVPPTKDAAAKAAAAVVATAGTPALRTSTLPPAAAAAAASARTAPQVAHVPAPTPPPGNAGDTQGVTANPSWQSAVDVLLISMAAVVGAGGAAALCLHLAWRATHEPERVGLRDERMRLERNFDRRPHSEESSEALLAENAGPAA